MFMFVCLDIYLVIAQLHARLSRPCLRREVGKGKAIKKAARMRSFLLLHTFISSGIILKVFVRMNGN